MSTTDPVPFDQLVTIAREVLAAAPWTGLNRTEWTEGIHARLTAQHLTHPPDHEIVAAMGHVLATLKEGKG